MEALSNRQNGYRTKQIGFIKDFPKIECPFKRKMEGDRQEDKWEDKEDKWDGSIYF